MELANPKKSFGSHRRRRPCFGGWTAGLQNVGKVELQTLGEDGAFVFANACPFGELRSASKSSFSFSPESNVRVRPEADGKLRVVEPDLRTQGMRVTNEIYERGG